MDASNVRSNFAVAREAASEPDATTQTVHDAVLFNVLSRREWQGIQRRNPRLADLIEKGVDNYVRVVRHVARTSVEARMKNIRVWQEATARGMRLSGPRIGVSQEDLREFLAWVLPNGKRAGDATIDDWVYARTQFTYTARGAARSARISQTAIQLLTENDVVNLDELFERRGGDAILPLFDPSPETPV